jgi:hypothetical protein
VQARVGANPTATAKQPGATEAVGTLMLCLAWMPLHAQWPQVS